MIDLLKSAAGFSWGLAVYGLDRVSRLLLDGPSSAMRETPAANERVIEAARSSLKDLPGGGSGSRGNSGRLDLSRMVVLGEGLAAGMGNFTLHSGGQSKSFPALIAAQTGAGFTQRLIQAPGLGNPPGFPKLPVRIPAPMQTTVVEPFPGPDEPTDLSICGLRIADALRLRPREPIVDREDARTTCANLVLGLEGFVEGRKSHRTQLETAVSLRPTFAVVCLGYSEVLEAAIDQDWSLLPSPQSFAACMSEIISELRGAGAEVLVTGVPNPCHTAWFTPVARVTPVVKIEQALLKATYNLNDDDLLTVPALIEIGNQFLSESPEELPCSSILRANSAAMLGRIVAQYNAEISRIAAEQGAHFFDLDGLLGCIRQTGIPVGGRLLTGDYLGGFYRLNGYYPGETGHAVIANHILTWMNAAFDASFPLVNLSDTMRGDPAAAYRVAEGPDWTANDLTRRSIPRVESTPPATESPSAPVLSTPTHPELIEALPRPIHLPSGLVVIMPLCRESSYFGEAIRAADCRDPSDAKFGSCPELLFGGLVMVDSHLSGNITIRFETPTNGFSHFEMSLGDGLSGDDSTLVAPRLYRIPFRQNRLTDAPKAISSGDLDLATGDVSNLTFTCGIATSGLYALARANPNFPKTPISFPGQYGSAWARFEQRQDGTLDFSFFGSTFLPLGSDLGGTMLRLPLPFSGPSMQFATIPARGMVMHPHVCLSTKPVALSAERIAPDLPENTIREFTLFSHNSSFGDHFSLSIPEFGGDGTGRSHLVGRLDIQFGQRSGNSIPVAVSSLQPGGLFIPLAESPIVQAFPGRLPMGPIGFDEFLRFPRISYFLEGVSYFDDPFDLSIGAVDVRTGDFLTELLHRGFLDQDVFLALLRIEPRTPKSSFYFRGPARMEAGAGGNAVFRLMSHVFVPFPPGFSFPQPDLAMSFTVGPNSVLDPYFWVQAMSPSEPGNPMAGSAQNLVASTGDRFSYIFRMPGSEGGPVEFEYINHSQDGSFRLHTLASVTYLRSPSTGLNSDCDAVSFTGFGIWTKDGLNFPAQASVHVSASEAFPYVGIQIDAGAISNANTKPVNMNDVRP